MKTVNIYLIKDELVQKAQRSLANSLKYLYETGGREKLEDGNFRPYFRYRDYLKNFEELWAVEDSTYTHKIMSLPESFMNTMMLDTETITEVVGEFLKAVSHYMLVKTGEEHKVTFPAYYFYQSFENSGQVHYSKYVKDTLMTELKISAKEIRENTLFELYRGES